MAPFSAWLLIFLALSLLIAHPSLAQAQPIKIGVLAPLTGVYAVVGDRTVKGVEFAVEEINSKGGVLGRKIEMIVRDDETNPEVAVRLAKRFMLQDNVVAIFGPLHGGAGIAVLNEVKRYKKAVQFPWAAVEEIVTEFCSRYTWRVGNSASQKSRAGAILGERSGLIKWATISSDFSYGRSVANEFTNYFKEIKPSVQFVHQAWPKLGEEDYSAHINQILAAKPEALYVGLFAGDAVKFIKQARMFGLFDKMRVYFDDSAHQSLLEALGDELPFGHYTGSRYYWKYFTNEKNLQFVEKFRKRYGGLYPDTFSGEAYSAVYVFAKAIEKANSADVEKIIDALAGLQVDTPEGRITMRAKDHQGIQSVLWGIYAKDPKYPFPVLDKIIELPAEQVAAPSKCTLK